ncbi:MAG: substrate-binding domain-containing protein [Jiangellales bacterium]
MLPAAALVLAACGSDDGDTTAEPEETGAMTEAAGDLTIGVSWNNFNEERWAKADEKAMKEVFDAEGVNYISTDAGSSPEQQVTDVQNLISQGADALIILAQDGTAILPAVEEAAAAGIPVVGYDRLIESPEAFYLTFDNVEVGRMQAQAIVDLVPEGNYVFIKGNQADANADFLRGGQEEVLTEAAGCTAITPDNPDAECPIKNVGESYTDNWAPEVAQTNMEQFLTQNNNEVDAVVASNDGMAGGVVAALEAQGLAGQVPVSGQDGDGAALNRVALGTQTVSVWKNAFALGAAAADIATQLAGGAEFDAISVDVAALDESYASSAPAAGPDAAPFTTPGGVDVTSIILTPIPVTQDNLNEPIDAGWVENSVVCAGVEAGAVPACE